MTARPDRLFLLAAALYLLVGAFLGVWMGLKLDFSWRPIHAHVNLMGWASLALFGVTYRIFPSLGASRLAWAHFFVAIGASLCFPVGLYQVSNGEDFGVIGSAGVILWIVSALLFIVAVTRLVLTKS